VVSFACDAFPVIVIGYEPWPLATYLYHWV